MGLSNAGLAAATLLSVMFFLGSELLRVSGYKRWLQGNARHLVGITVCIIISIAEIVTLIYVSTYVPSGLTMPSHYVQGYGWARQDCFNSTKGPKADVLDGKFPRFVKINTTSGNTIFSSGVQELEVSLCVIETAKRTKACDVQCLNPALLVSPAPAEPQFV